MNNINKLLVYASFVAGAWLLSAGPSLSQEQLYNQNEHADMLPELSAVGKYKVGVKTLNATNSEYVDVYTQKIQARSLSLEIWYPTSEIDKPLTSYENEMRSGAKFSALANASRDVAFDDAEQWPLIVLSHGYTGYRTIMFYLGEHLASHGYVVVGIDHTDSTNADIDFATAPYAGFMSTLLNRSRDQQFVLDYLANTGNVQTALGSEKWIAEKAGVIGYSMGGFGALNTAGACYDFPKELLARFVTGAAPENAAQIKAMQMALNSCSAGQYPAKGKVTTDPRWHAMMAFAPWGGQHKVFSDSSLAEITVPTMLISGDLDDISIYAGIQDIYAQFKNNDHYLLTFLNARHNIAPHPAPSNAWSAETDYGHYYEPAWSQQALNNINKHFSLAMMDCHVKDNVDACAFLTLSGNSNQTQAESGLSEPWKGFDNRYSTGMEFKRGKHNK